MPFSLPNIGYEGHGLAASFGYPDAGGTPIVDTFTITINTEAVTPGATTGTFITNGTVNYDIYWGDDSSETINVVSGINNANHTYAVAGIYDVKVRLNSGTMYPYFNNVPEGDLVTKIGATPNTWTIGDMFASFNRCDNLVDVSVKAKFEGVSRLSQAFAYTAITSWPAMSIPDVTDFSSAWNNNTAMTEFKELTCFSATSFNNAWQNNSNLVNFELPVFGPNCGSFIQAWQGCSSIVNFPKIVIPVAGSCQAAWNSCRAMTSFPADSDLSKVTDLQYAWYNTNAMGAFPALDLGSCSNFKQAWALSGMSSIGICTVSSGTNFQAVCQYCLNLTSFPAWQFPSSATTFLVGWYGCYSLSDFAAGCFDNCTTTTNYEQAFQDCALTAQSIENILVSIDTGGAINGTLGLNGGTNASRGTWSAAALTAEANLLGKGWTIASNP